jgi:hypothetical protein
MWRVDRYVAYGPARLETFCEVIMIPPESIDLHNPDGLENVPPSKVNGLAKTLFTMKGMKATKKSSFSEGAACKTF